MPIKTTPATFTIAAHQANLTWNWHLAKHWKKKKDTKKETQDFPNARKPRVQAFLP